MSELTGAELKVYSTPDSQQYVALVSSNEHIQTGQRIKLAFDLARAHFFDNETESRIR